MALISSKVSLTLDLPPSCITFCPSNPQFFVVGTYLLHQKEHLSAESNTPDAGAVDDEANSPIQQEHDEDAAQDVNQLRTGSLILFRLKHDNEVM